MVVAFREKWGGSSSLASVVRAQSARTGQASDAHIAVRVSGVLSALTWQLYRIYVIGANFATGQSVFCTGQPSMAGHAPVAAGAGSRVVDSLLSS